MKKASAFLVFLSLSTSVFANEAAGGPSPGEALALLKEGHSRFLTGTLKHPHQDAARRLETAKGQAPYAAVLGCSDSREALDTLFDAGIGDLFTIRVAGNVADTDEIASLEYGAEHLHVPLIVVMGHSSCGAVTAVVTKAKLTGELPGLLAEIQGPSDRIFRKLGAKSQDLVDETSRENVRQSVQDMLTRSKILSTLVEEGNLKVVGAFYHLDTGEVEWMENLTNASQWVKAGLKAPEVVAAVPVARERDFWTAILGPLLVLLTSFGLLALVQKLFVSDNRVVRGLKLNGRLVVSNLALVAVLGASAAVTAALADPWLFGAALVPGLVFTVLYARAHYHWFKSYYEFQKKRWTTSD